MESRYAAREPHIFSYPWAPPDALVRLRYVLGTYEWSCFLARHKEAWARISLGIGGTVGQSAPTGWGR